MTRETKVGLMMVAVVVGVFGFLIYKRVHQPIEGFADQNTQEQSRVVEQERSSDFLEDRESPAKAQPSFRKRERAAIREVEQVADQVADFTTHVAEHVVEEVTPAPRPRKKPPLPVDLSANDDDFAQFTEPRKPREEPRRIQMPDPAEDAFDSNQQPAMQPPPAPARISQVSDSSQDFSDPFSDDSVEKEKPVRTVQFDEPPRRDRRVANSDDMADRGYARESRSQSPVAEMEPATDEPRRVQEFDDTFDTSSRNRRRPAPSSFVEERTVRADRVARDSEIRAAVSGDGQSYTIQPNDNFWSISRKIYGAGRYYKALAAHNQQTIPDPRMMRPGVVIVTPDVSVLEQRYAELIPKAGPADPVTSVSTTQSRQSVESEPAGYFVSTDGVPMYRIGENDTLTGIAKAHLGRTSRWVQILEMNRNVLRDGNELKIGTVLRLPADASRVQVVGTPREFR